MQRQLRYIKYKIAKVDQFRTWRHVSIAARAPAIGCWFADNGSVNGDEMYEGVTFCNNCTVRRCSLLLDALQLWRSCCCTGRKVRRSSFRKLSRSRRSWPASYSRIHPIQPLRFRKLRGDMPFGEPFG